jgi:short-chain fatty acids transporter
MIAAGYTTMVLGQAWCPSASVYALVATKGHFLEKSIGIITQDVSTYNIVNTVLFFILAAMVILLAVFTKPPVNEVIGYTPNEESNMTAATVEADDYQAGSFANMLNSSRILMLLMGLSGAAVIVHNIIKEGPIGALNFNFVIFIFLTLNMFLYSTPVKFVQAFKDMARPGVEIMLQYPFYGGITGLMVASGMDKVSTDLLLRVATSDTIYAWAFLSSAFVNLFIPSQGGQWIVQGPILVEAAKALNADIPLILNAFVQGDEVTNLLQPLFVIPALALVGMKLKEVWGFMAFICMFWLAIGTVGLIVLPKILM